MDIILNKYMGHRRIFFRIFPIAPFSCAAIFGILIGRILYLVIYRLFVYIIYREDINEGLHDREPA